MARAGPGADEEVLIVEQAIDDRQQRAAERLPTAKQVVQIGARIIPRRRAAALHIERPRILGVAGVLDVDRPEACERQTVTAITGGHHAIEHIDAARDGLQDVVRGADAHEITRLLDGQSRRRFGDDLEHDLLGFANGESAERVALEADFGQAACALLAQGLIVAALHDAEQRASGSGIL